MVRLLTLFAVLALSPAAPSAPAPRAAAPGMPAIARAAGGYDGVVVEVLPAASYTYLRVRRADGGEAWAVTLKQARAAGDRVHVRRFGTKDDFRSPRLGRTFDHLDFAVVTSQEDT